MLQPRPSYRNQLLSGLTPADLALLEPHLETVVLNVHDTLEAPGTAITHAYFIEAGIVSIVAEMPRGRNIEVGIIGRDGMTGVAIVQGDWQTPNTTFVQMTGSASRIEAEAFRATLQRSPTLGARLNLYARALGLQVSATALANGRSKIEERLARWLLMIQDRTDGNHIALTHEFLASMLGVRRPGVTVVLHILEGKGVIRCNRGDITILDRDGLIVIADSAYGAPEKEYDRLLGRPAASPPAIHLVT
jgi:CRP-like cAMP-binding protein